MQSSGGRIPASRIVPFASSRAAIATGKAGDARHRRQAVSVSASSHMKYSIVVGLPSFTPRTVLYMTQTSRVAGSLRAAAGR